MLRRSPLRQKRPTPRRKGAPVPHIKPGRVDDPVWMERVRQFGCWCCLVDGFGWVYADAHHPREGGTEGAGAGQKAPDRDAIPLCAARHHNVQVPGFLSIHRHPVQFRERYGSESQIRDWMIEAMKRRGTYEAPKG